MKKVLENKIVLVNVIAAVVLICVFFYFMSGKETVEINPAVSTDCKDITNSYTKDACYFELAVKNLDTGSCGKIIDASQEDLCYAKIALEKADKKICDLILDKYYTRPKCAAEIDNLKTGQLS